MATASPTGGTQIFTVAEIAAEWKFSPDTIQRWFADEPGVFVVQRDEEEKRTKALRQPKKTLRIPAHAKERVWRRNCNSPAPVN
jgi:hypothetical protein